MKKFKIMILVSAIYVTVLYSDLINIQHSVLSNG